MPVGLRKRHQARADVFSAEPRAVIEYYTTMRIPGTGFSSPYITQYSSLQVDPEFIIFVSLCTSWRGWSRPGPSSAEAVIEAGAHRERSSLSLSVDEKESEREERQR